jgi:thiopurine S-methyltransferase
MPEIVDLSEAFWDNRYQSHDTGWDIGRVSRPLKAYIDQLSNKDLKILIPGAGNAHEAEYLWRQGFRNVFVIDLSEKALENLKNRIPEFPQNQMIHGDFFDLQNTFDLILEQTFFCAIHPDLRNKYVAKMYDLLEDKGKLVGVLFNDVLNSNHPPFGGSKPEYEKYFTTYFTANILEMCYNSIESRSGRELFIKFTKK